MTAITSGTISAQNTNPTSGVPTVNSTVGYQTTPVPVGSNVVPDPDTITIQVTGTYTGALTPQVSNDGVNWVTMGGTPLQNVGIAASSATIGSGSTGVWIVNVGGYAAFRLSANGAVTGSATVTISVANSVGSVNVAGTITSSDPTGTPTITGVASSATSGTILAANAARKGVIFQNNSTATLYLRFASSAASIAQGGYTDKVSPGSSYGLVKPIYTGAITGIWDAANGFVNVTELV